MKTTLKVIIIFFLLGILAFAGYIAYRVLTPNPDDLGSSCKYQSKDELKDL